MLVFFGSVFANACDYDCKAQLRRIADALEIIAGNMGNKQTPKAQEPKQQVTEQPVIASNFGAPKPIIFEPRNPTEFVFEEFEVEETCEEKCKKKNYSDYTRNMCIKNNCKEDDDF
jgi:hypothetical protein